MVYTVQYAQTGLFSMSLFSIRQILPKFESKSQIIFTIIIKQYNIIMFLSVSFVPSEFRFFHDPRLYEIHSHGHYMAETKFLMARDSTLLSVAFEEEVVPLPFPPSCPIAPSIPDNKSPLGGMKMIFATKYIQRYQ